MISDIDIHRAAWLMIRRYGEDTAVQTSVRADEMLDKVEVAAWRRDGINEAIVLPAFGI